MSKNNNQAYTTQKFHKVVFIVGIAFAIIGSGISTYAATSYNSAEISYSNSTSGMSATNVQNALTETYNHVTDYSTISSTYFQNNQSSLFSADLLMLGYRDASTTDKGLAIYHPNGSNKIGRSILYYLEGTEITRLAALKSDSNYGGKLDLRGSPVRFNGTNFQAMFTVVEYKEDNISVTGTNENTPAYGTASKTINVTKSGYTPLHATCSVANASSGGSGAIYMHFSNCYVSGNKVYVYAINTRSTAAKVRFVVEVLYVKNT